jgi:helix-turn-helix protein
MDGVWDRTTPSSVLEARLVAADRMIRRFAPDAVGNDATVEAADIAREAAEVAATRPEGRPLFAGHASLPWPDEPHLVLWHAQTLLREYRGDNHIAALTIEGLNGCEALVTHAFGEEPSLVGGSVSADVLKTSRQRTDHDWATAVASLQARGWIDDAGAPTELGRERRRWIEVRTDELSVGPYAAVGEERCARLRELGRPWSVALMGAFAG